MEWRGFCESTLNARVAFSGVFLQISETHVKIQTPVVSPQGKIKNPQGKLKRWKR
jgi:hypothetical protein